MSKTSHLEVKTVAFPHSVNRRQARLPPLCVSKLFLFGKLSGSGLQSVASSLDTALQADCASPVKCDSPSLSVKTGRHRAACGSAALRQTNILLGGYNFKANCKGWFTTAVASLIKTNRDAPNSCFFVLKSGKDLVSNRKTFRHSFDQVIVSYSYRSEVRL